ncbi:MAG TPA: PilZ domain-containing protein [Burkholderiales bacterium]|nr:PilZ domain-containing protein [Burkholderiales bacterium]
MLPGRREPRFESDLAVELDGGSARARNVSASGIYFETAVPFRKGSDLRFTVQFAPVEGAPLRMECRARVVRVERLVGRFGVGAAIQHFNFVRERKATDESA